MSSRYKVHEDYKPHFITSTVVDWVDALSRPVYKDIIVNSLKFSIEAKGLQLHAWVIMSNHFHLIASAKEGNSLAAIIRDIKKFTSAKIVESIINNPQESRRKWMVNAFSYAGRNNTNVERHQFWQHGFHPVELSSQEMFTQRLNYVHDNPVRAGIVREAKDYIYSSAFDYYNSKEGLLPLLMF